MTQLAKPVVQPAEQEKPLYNINDTRLALSNAAVLTVDYFAGSKFFNIPVSSRFFPLMLIANLWQRIQTYLSIPDSAPIEKMLAHPIIPLMGLISPTVGKVSAVASLIGIARNSVPKLIVSLKNVTKKPREALTAAALHIFNLATQGYFTKTSFEAYDKIHKPYNTEDFHEEWKKNHQTNSDWEKWFKEQQGKPFDKKTYQKEWFRQREEIDRQWLDARAKQRECYDKCFQESRTRESEWIDKNSPKEFREYLSAEEKFFAYDKQQQTQCEKGCEAHAEELNTERTKWQESFEREFISPETREALRQSSAASDEFINSLFR